MLLRKMSARLTVLLFFAVFGIVVSEYQPYRGIDAGQSANQYNSGQYGKYGGLDGHDNNPRSVQVYHLNERSMANHMPRAHQLTQQQHYHNQPRSIQNSHRKTETGKATFETELLCLERCEVECSNVPLFFDPDQEPKMKFLCEKMRPPKKALHEKLFKAVENAGPFEYTVGAILSFAIVLCCLCSCYQCCCKRQSIRHHHHTRNFGSSELAVNNNQMNDKTIIMNGGSHITGLSPELESLTNSANHGKNNSDNNIQHIDEVGAIHSAPLGKEIGNGGFLGSIGNGGGQQHQQQQQPLVTHNSNNHHRFPHSATGGFTMGSREQSIV